MTVVERVLEPEAATDTVNEAEIVMIVPQIDGVEVRLAGNLDEYLTRPGLNAVM